MSKPYINYDIITTQNTKQFTRLIPEHSDDTELKWHRDTYDRYITIKSGLNWYLQFDNQLPIEPLMKINFDLMVLNRAMRDGPTFWGKFIV